ncbi:hypothetical protein NBZ79_00310 [Sneathiella marina]|uniref:DUF4189 domain-containing protein n=1 Tax=Sneathiella marina TaxID=2950108 RepID=A0ABY4W379_9PROT|nr:hypothetical protein [Sneathiella marina]USG61417.1 hypothetical protein NBZ79_00310 [Sneathiella marina]
MRLFALVIATLLTLTACQTTEKAGSGPISNMPGKSVRAYQAYKLAIEKYPRHNFAFVYNASGYSYGWSGQKESHGQGYAVEKAMENCTKGSSSGTCKLLDLDGRIVWKGMDPRVLASLLEEPPKFADTRTHEYDGMEYRITDRQLKRFTARITTRERYDFTAYFVSGDGINYGEGFSTGRSPSGHSSTVRNAREACQIASPERKCYLFAANGEPINDDARRALEREN